jgi:low temperature requirement protein LtrA
MRLIALGETVVTPGAALAGAPVQLASLASGSLALAGTLCLWWLYFRAEPLALRQVTSTGDRAYVSRMGVNGLLLMIAGLIALAAGNALVIDHPTRGTSLAVALMLFGGPVLFLAARAWYQWLVLDAAPRLQLSTIVLLTAAAGASRAVPGLAAALAVVVMLAGLAVAERTGQADTMESTTSQRPV